MKPGEIYRSKTAYTDVTYLVLEIKGKTALIYHLFGTTLSTSLTHNITPKHYSIRIGSIADKHSTLVATTDATSYDDLLARYPELFI